jgi:hypothetical protein
MPHFDLDSPGYLPMVVVVVVVVMITITTIVTNADDHENLIWGGRSLFVGSCTSYTWRSVA